MSPALPATSSSRIFQKIFQPGIGDRVALTLDRAGFVRAITVVTAALPDGTPGRSPDRPGHPDVTGPVEPSSAPGAPQQRPVDRDRRILRQAVLNTAVALLQSGGRVPDLPQGSGHRDPDAAGAAPGTQRPEAPPRPWGLADILATAEALEAWVLR